MSTIICSSCGTRNLADVTSCRRCGEPMGDVVPTDGVELPEVIAERWRVGQPLPGTDNPYLYLGEDEESGRRVLIKRLSRAAARDRTLRSQFHGEVELLEDLDHSNLVDLVDMIEEEEALTMILEGQGEYTLAELLARTERIPVGIALEFGLQILDTLDYLHSKRVTHRRLMPTKILVGRDAEQGFPKLTIVDFGLAHRSEVMTLDELEYGPGTLVGMKATDTVGGVARRPYQAPEQLEGESDERTDVYALGAILFEMLTGDVPVSSDPHDESGTERSIRTEKPTQMRLLRPEVSANFEAVVQKMLEKEPGARYGDAQEAREALLATPEAKREAMVAVPGGPFVRGSANDDEDARPEEQPQQKIELGAFYIDRNPVTVADYKAYLDATGQSPSPEWEEFNDVQNAPEQPVVYVNWKDAKDYARWAGKRLPTEAEWEKAARGADGRTYPWGDEPPTEERAHFDADQPDPVGARKAGASPWGVHDMAGNVFEWVLDWYDADYYAKAPERDPTGPESGAKKVIRGGSFAHGPFALRCATRGRYKPGARRANHGFRCAWSLDL